MGRWRCQLKADDSAYRSLTPKPGWIQNSCDRCNRDFWLTPAQHKNGIKYCTSTCRFEAPEKVIERTMTKGPGENDCWISSLSPKSAYPHIKIKGDTLRVARVVLEKSLGRPIGENLKALHKCNNPRCVRVGPEHIYEGTQQENIKWCVESGRMDDRNGEKCPTAELTTEQVIEIKKLFGKQGLKETMIQFGRKSKTTIWNIWHGKTWKHVDVPPDAE